MRNITLILLTFLSFALSACSNSELPKDIIPKTESEFAQNYLRKLIDKDFEYAISHVHPDVINLLPEAKLEKIVSYFPSGELLSVDLVGANIRTFNSDWTGKFSYECHFSDGWVVSSIALTRLGGDLKVNYINVLRTQAPLKEINAFSTAKLTGYHILMLLLSVIIPLFMLFTCYQVYKTPIPSKKWQWYLASFIGIGSVSFNWTTGEILYQLLTVKFLGFGIVKASPYAPWVLTFTVPIGAIIFWTKRKKYIEKSMVNQAVEPTRET